MRSYDVELTWTERTKDSGKHSLVCVLSADGLYQALARLTLITATELCGSEDSCIADVTCASVVASLLNGYGQRRII